jgi:hypothetical protein
MAVAHVQLDAPALEEASLLRRLAIALGWTSVFALAAVPSLVAVLLLTRPDLFLGD